MSSHDREPSLRDLLTDPATVALMASDGIAADEVRNLMAEVRRRYGVARASSRRRS
ncbi:MAG TPA: hypothetical protein VN632_07340 [Stellaceae bacterium]|nr:hypothetical protein [Stellaceae bacterium]